MKSVSNHALLFVGAGLYLALGGMMGYSTVNAILLLWLGIDRFRQDRQRLALILIVISAVVLVVKQIGIVFIIVLISLGIYYMKAPRPHLGQQLRKAHRLMLKLRMDQPSWVLQSISNWHVFGEVRMDLSVAVPEERETLIVLQGIVGDVDLIVPEDYGLEVEASVMIGQAGWNNQREGGFHQQVRWRSPDYDSKGQKVKLQLFYLVGNIRIRPI